MRRRTFAFLPFLTVAVPAQIPPEAPAPRIPRSGPPGDIHLPNGKSQKNAIAKADYEKNLEDATELIKLSEALKAELEKNAEYVVSTNSIKKTEDIEKLAKRIRSRLKQ
ncbi:MAG TPA: hypothetical protein VKV15_01430 [Bryobacteraceae bacterium]|nr:hypothetical protein [Bryobacteraceae bacterium]